MFYFKYFWLFDYIILGDYIIFNLELSKRCLMECEVVLLALVLMNHCHWNLIIIFINMDSIIIKNMECILRIKLIFKIKFVITNVMLLPKEQGSTLIKIFCHAWMHGLIHDGQLQACQSCL